MYVKRAYRFRFYPTLAHEPVFSQHFGCVRFVSNHMLARRQQRYTDKQPTSYKDDSSALTLLKKDPAYAWLNDVSSVALQQALRHLDSAFKNFFSGRARFPRFKRKQAAQSFTLMRNAFTLRNGKLTLAKMKEPLDVRWSRELPCEPSSVTVSRDAVGRYFVSLLCEMEVSALPESDKTTAFDLGLSSFLTFADDRSPVAPQKFLAKLLHRVRPLSRALSRKINGSKSRAKARERLARLHARIRDMRRDFLHKLSTGLIRESQAVFAETLSIRGMLKSRLARSIGDAAWGELLRQLAYKASWYGRTFWQAPRTFASSKTCSDCGFKLKALALSTRSWICPDCGSIHERDKNAARNILAAGIQATSTAGRAGA
ncbi:transposase [Cupriavidus necator]|uniref:Transposase n=1 Tax=Cupriavidus necator TaxID=106590 RepID=A0A367P7P7_CUPNE|nr:RNA-guided endonuclease TnpB family protein [Cupriavidus necator]QQX88945.1 transposase [Cupriavidus necator]RCJ03205.1 transposase [Cupriavidus necator]